MRKGRIFEEGTKNDEDRMVDMPGWYMDEMKRFRKQWRKQRLLVGYKWEGGDNEYVLVRTEGLEPSRMLSTRS
jgi:integrase